MIDEKKLIAKMQIKKDELEADAPFGDEFCRGFAFAMEFVKTQTTASAWNVIQQEPKVMEWIPVTERLPETEERVIGTFKGVNEENIVLAVYFHPRFLKAPLPMVAWMPLPEPYKGE